MSNAILEALTLSDKERLRPYLKAQDMHPKSFLQDSGLIHENTWFPIGAAAASYLISDRSGRSVAVNQIGREGMIRLRGDENVYSPLQVLITRGGQFLRIHNDDLENAKVERLSIRRWMDQYNDFQQGHLLQEIYCAKSHTVMQRASRHLLDIHARTGSADISMTQENLAEYLGVGRPFVNRVINDLRKQGAVETRRAVMRIRDEQKLREIACECHHALSRNFPSLNTVKNAAG